MTDTVVAANSPEDIEDDLRPSEALEREADAILAEDAARREAHTGRPVTSVRQAVREDASLGRDWVEAKVDRARSAVRDEPVRATLYALGAGVLLGLLLNR